MALDENLAGFNINTSAASEFVLQEIMNMVWPQAFIVNNKLQPVLNSQLLESAAVTSTSPQTVVYKLNPKAVWSDGTPITADDFIYNWQAQSGNPAYTDVGGQPYDAASTAGYSQIASVVGSDPSGGAACAPGSTADRNVGLCPNGRTVTVTFKPSFADWRSLFTNIVPAHIARTVGWNTGFTGPTQTISGSWFTIQSYNENQSLVLTRNPTYWGTPAKLQQARLPVLLGRQPAGAGAAEQGDRPLQPVDGEPLDRPDGQPGPEHHEGDAARTRVRALRLQPGRPVPGQGAGPRGDRPRRQPPGHHHPHGRPDRQGHQPRSGSRMLVPTQPGYQGTSYAYRPEPVGQPAQGARLQEGLRRLLPAQLRPAEGPGPDLHHPVDLGQHASARRPRSSSRPR